MIKLIADPLVTDIFAKLSVLLSTTNVGALCKNATRIDMSEKLAGSNETNARRARRPHARLELGKMERIVNGTRFGLQPDPDFLLRLIHSSATIFSVCS